MRRARFCTSGGKRQGDSAKDLLTESSSSLDGRTRKEKNNSGARGQPSPINSALAVNLRQQLRRSQSTFASNFDAPVNPRQQLRRSGQTSPATPALLVNLCQQLRPSHFGAPTQPSPATLALLVNLRQQLSAFAVGPCGFSVPLRPLDIFLARTHNHPRVLLLQVMCFIL